MRRLALTLLLSMSLSATVPTVRESPTKQLKEYDTGIAVAVGTSLEVISSVDVYVTFIQLTNTTAGELTVTVADRQGSPIALLSAVPIAAKTTYVIQLSPRWCSSGVTWIASGSGITGYMRLLK